MEDRLDVLVLENRPGAAMRTAAVLEDAGHRVHRCHDADGAGLACRGVAPGRRCPLDEPVDVAVVARDGVSPRPSVHEQGVLCAIHRGVPVVETGSDILDPFAPWISERSRDETEVVPACRTAMARSYEPLHEVIAARLAPILEREDLASHEVTCTVARRGKGLSVRLAVDRPVSSSTEQALAVRALDAVRADRRRYASVDVDVVSRA